MDVGWVMCWQAPEVAEGFELEDYLPDDVAVWPCHAQAAWFFTEFCGTQWRYRPDGCVAGLDYTAVLACIKTLGLKRKEADRLFADVRQIERGAVEASCKPGEQLPSWRQSVT